MWGAGPYSASVAVPSGGTGPQGSPRGSPVSSTRQEGEDMKGLQAKIELLECENRAMKRVIEVQEEGLGDEEPLTRWREEVFKLLVQVSLELIPRRG